MKFSYLIVILAVFISVVSCKKDKTISARLSGESWNVVEILIDSQKVNHLPVLSFNECSIYKENCYATWTLKNENSIFIWQVRDKAKTFEISNQSDFSDSVSEAILQCMNFSGIYEITDKTKTSMKIKTDLSVGYPGKEVIIRMQIQ